MRPKSAILGAFAALAIAGFALNPPWAASARDLALQWWDRPVERHAPGSPAVRSRIVAEGRIVACPGAKVTLASEISGTITQLPVRELQQVRKGDLLVQLGCDEPAAALAEAQARVMEIDADLSLFDARMRRVKTMFERGVATDLEFLEANHNLQLATAKKKAALATVARLQAQLARATIRAPIDGTVVARYVDVGEMVMPAQPLVTIADLSRTRIEAEVDEFDLGRIRLGADVAVIADGYPDQRWMGKVEELPEIVVARRLKPDDPGRLSDSRVLLAKIALTEAAPLKLGQRVEVRIAIDPKKYDPSE